ncbi:hypothetical protein [Caulobacter sp. FWC2]|uniref:hypothetical protein n=1 Tax=Caulobacter sp. FWC2 TaxID=69664 RepID=UPI000C147727|nr:hypothetical protein [Caulobacter sp. FWC2]PIB93710.1 hypothetical protein CSW62_20305 [Caulobacter sp. FWC2]
MIQFDISVSGAPQVKGSKWTAKVQGSTEPAFLVGQTVAFQDGDGQHRGLHQPSLSKLPKLYYDREAAAASIGLWAHFMWPTVTAEGGGHHLVLNTYDRARFTFGFYQLAAHTPKDNLILLFRALLKLPKAADYFPDLHLLDGKVWRTENGTSYSLETETQVHRPNGKVETQLVGFMSYLNPDTTTAGEAEARNGAKLMHWLLNDPLAIDASVKVASGIMRRKVQAAASRYGLVGKDPRLAIWTSDITHQGRGVDKIPAALAKPTLAAQLTALSVIGSDTYPARCTTVAAKIAQLHTEAVFDGVTLGDAQLPLRD